MLATQAEAHSLYCHSLCYSLSNSRLYPSTHSLPGLSQHPTFGLLICHYFTSFTIWYKYLNYVLNPAF